MHANGYIRALVVCLAVVGIAGCASHAPVPAAAVAPAATEATPTLTPEVAPARRLYRIGPKDVIQIQVYRRDDLNKQMPVRDDGTIFLPLAGVVKAEGKTVTELAAELKARLAEYVKEPQVDVIVASYRAHVFSLLGEVHEPGSFSLQADTRLLDALGNGKGFTDKANLRDSYLVRDGRILPLDLYALFRKGDVSQNVYLEPGDFVYVASRELTRVYVLGEVNLPQVVPIIEGRLTLPEAIAAAGGFNETTAFKSNVKVIRGGLAHPRVTTVNFEDFLHGRPGQEVELESGDIVFVPASGVAKWSRIIGQILPNLSQFIVDAAAIGSITK